MRQRILGFDLARAWAIFGMFIVNFMIVYGNFMDPSPAGRLLSLFTGNASISFVMLAGMGVSLLSWRPEATMEEKQQLRRTILHRSWFLFALGLLLYPWWTGDILHFYGGYMHLAAFFLFVQRRWLLGLVLTSVLIFHVLFFIVPYDTGWNFERFEYLDFWTPIGFLRNTFYNGWNPIFPWSALFFFGMWLGRLNWKESSVRKKAFWVALLVFIPLECLMYLAQNGHFSPEVQQYLLADYVPPFLPFLVSGASIGVAVMVICLWLGERFAMKNWLLALAQTGQMTLTHYVTHLTLGMIALGAWSGQAYGPPMNPNGTASSGAIFSFSFAWFVGSVLFSFLWKKRFKNGPMEWLMRKVAG